MNQLQELIFILVLTAVFIVGFAAILLRKDDGLR